MRKIPKNRHERVTINGIGTRPCITSTGEIYYIKPSDKGVVISRPEGPKQIAAE